MEDDQKLWLRARKRAEEKAGFFVHLGIYLAVNTFLILMWYTTTGPGTYPWFWLITAGWGIGVVGHFVSVFAGEGYIEHASRREFDRLKNQGP
jgi:uncharacterized protein (DUF486 family)